MARAVGVDLSHYDLTFDPAKATKQIDFAIQKASEKTTKDPKFETIWEGVKKVPIRGAYHYLRSDTDYEVQAKFFLSVVAGHDFHFFACDYEGINNVMDSVFATMAHKWIDYVIAKTNMPVLLYTNPSHYDADLFPYGDWMQFYPLWLAQYWNDPSPDKKPALPKRRINGWNIWQWASEINYAGHGKEYGCGGNSVDLNVYNGTVEQMRAWLGLGETVDNVTVAKIKMLDWMIAQCNTKRAELE